jgi:carboxymethylenebutenolidase
MKSSALSRHCHRLILWGTLVAAASGNAGVPHAPTAENELPAAITGNAGPLQGTNAAYYAANPRTLGYLALPAEPGPHPSVILIHEWNGLDQRVKETADAFAAEGYIALAADLYSGRTGSSREENMALVHETLAEPDELVANLEAAVAFLNAREDTTGRTAAIGWCYGGGVALSFALGSSAHEGTAIFYGRLLDDPQRMQHIHHPIYGTFARNDTGIPVDQVDAFVAALRSAGIDNDVHIYDHVQHGFWLHVDRDPETSMGPALDAWQRLKAYLKRVLGS